MSGFEKSCWGVIIACIFLGGLNTYYQAYLYLSFNIGCILSLEVSEKSIKDEM